MLIYIFFFCTEKLLYEPDIRAVSELEILKIVKIFAEKLKMIECLLSNYFPRVLFTCSKFYIRPSEKNINEKNIFYSLKIKTLKNYKTSYIA